MCVILATVTSGLPSEQMTVNIQFIIRKYSFLAVSLGIDKVWNKGLSSVLNGLRKLVTDTDLGVF